MKRLAGEKDSVFSVFEETLKENVNESLGECLSDEDGFELIWLTSHFVLLVELLNNFLHRRIHVQRLPHTIVHTLALLSRQVTLSRDEWSHTVLVAVESQFFNETIELSLLNQFL